tara:strand:+ start:147 stop:551 length:405 start_codon:yes stop_codon:yes gene_type:complete
MKITKSQLRQLIKEETAAVLSEGDDWYDDEYETLADRKFARDEAGEWPGVEDPDDDSDDAAELEAGLDLTGFELKKERGSGPPPNSLYFIVDKETGEKVLGPFPIKASAEERMSDPGLRGDYEAAQDVLSKLGR